MTTLRTYTNPIEAGLAKSLLESHAVLCALADENANVYGGAPFAMPVRLMVAESQLEDARRLLDEAGKALPNSFQPQASAVTGEESIGD